ncbi:bile acid:sodium symporter family protein [Patiriisocius sp. Uisw_047]|uniref:bile acid:sodium symporter family protein n=1 Tax=Patiriisocius sp. Uisw_047 TaxID=3230969 RepID=UPI0039EB7FC2
MDSLSTAILGLALLIVMLGMGLTLQFSDFKRVLLYPKAIFVGLTNQLIILPLIGLGITMVFSLPPEVAVGIMILAACPGGPTSNLISHLAKGDLALSVTLTAVSSLITILTIPFIVNFALVRFMGEGQVVALGVLQTILQVFVIVVIPIIIGMSIRKYYPRFALKMAKPVRITSAVVLALIIIGLVIKERENFVAYFEQAGIAALLLNILTMGIGYIAAKLFTIPKAGSIAIAIESGIQNGTLAITVAVVLLNNTAFAIAPAVYSLLMFMTGGVIIYFGSRSKQV